MPRAEFVPFAAMPVIVTLPEVVDKILADELRKTPRETVPVPHDVPLIFNAPEVVETRPSERTPVAVPVPFAAVPVIVTLPGPVAEILPL